MRILPEDPRLIDFALGELDPEEYALIAAALEEEENRDARALVDEMRGLSAAAGRALEAPETPCLTETQRSAIVEHAAESPRRRPERMPRRSGWLRPVIGLGTAMLLGTVLLIVGLGGLRGSHFGLETEATKTAASPGKAADKNAITSEELDRLRALGYLGGDETLPVGQMSGTAETSTDSPPPIPPINPTPSSPESAAPATVVLASDDALEPLNIELPEASFKGTPCPYWSPVLEPDDYKDRPAYMVPKGTTILSRSKPVTSSEAPMLGKLTQLTDGDKDYEKKCVVELPAGLQWVQLDLEAEHTIYGLVAWHYHDEKWVFFDIIVQVSDSPDFSSGVTTLYNNDYDNSAGLGIGADKEYIESYKGRLIQIPNGVHARYVRLYSNGNTTNEMNDYIEVEVYGQPAAGEVEQIAKTRFEPDSQRKDQLPENISNTNEVIVPASSPTSSPSNVDANEIYLQLCKILDPFYYRPLGLDYSDQTISEIPNNLLFAIKKYGETDNTLSAKQKIVKDLKEIEEKAQKEERWRMVKYAIESLDVLVPGSKTTLYSKDFAYSQLMINKPEVKIIGFQESNGETLASVKVHDPVSLFDNLYLIREGEEFHSRKNEDGTTCGPLVKMLHIIGDKHSVEFLYIPANITWTVLGPGEKRDAGYVPDSTIAPPPPTTPASPPAPVLLASANGMGPLKIDLPEPFFGGTPVDYWSPNLEPEDYKDRPEIMVPAGTVLLSRDKPVTASCEALLGELRQINDGDKDYAKSSRVELGAGVQWVRIDLERECTLYALTVWHFHEGKRVYYDIVAQVSDTPDFSSGVTTVYNNDYDNSAGLGVGKDMEYIENNKGRLIPISNGVTARYVRFYSNGNTTDEKNHYVEIEVFGIPVK